ncbi:(2Fe-2S) ferredoxin domain-containing protein [Argonema galeatum]|uniref:(2Fe-2S) ferredoxin domain-containing protein n=1 Tax=Argonema galeatum TaxID=2942762 RepID=UPI0020113E4B|nr:(2Fe-2S) ferredoxin domain-containing protein [Argonema galeatum]MCL1465440.1 (2Fe-2S) ferredoxin domain-containing protein [Argonema galeatum A003/A1]
MPEPRCVLICQNRSCLKNGSAEVLEAFQAAKVSGVTVESSPCMGQCSSGPTVRIVPDETWYCRIEPSDVPTIVETHLLGGKPVEAKLNPRIHLRIEMFSS